MINMQKERMRHLLSSAILELWKKETGSLTSVGIEGTVCITSQNGRTTTIQVSDQFPGPMPNGDNGQQEASASNHNNICCSNDQKSPPSHCRDYPTTTTTVGSGQGFSTSSEPETSPKNRINLMPPTSRCDAHAPPKMKPKSEKSNHRINQVCRNLWRGGNESDKWNRRHRSVTTSGTSIPRAPAHVIKDDNNNDEVDEESSPDLSPASFRWTTYNRQEDDDVNVDKSSDDDEDLSNSSDLDGSLDSKSPLRNKEKSQSVQKRKSEDDDDDVDDDKNDSAVQDMSLDLSFSDCNNSKFIFPPFTPNQKSDNLANPKKAAAWMQSGVKKAMDIEPEEQTFGHLNSGDRTINDVLKNEAMMANVNRQRDPELYLSSPDSYTAQVRDAIRRQILANTSRTMLPIFSPSPLGGVPGRSTAPWSRSHPSPSSDSHVKKARETPYSRSTVDGGTSSIFWGPPPNTPTRLETANCTMGFHATAGSSQLDFKLFVPFVQPNVFCGRALTAASQESVPSYTMLAPPCLPSTDISGTGKSAEEIRKSLHSHLAGRDKNGGLDSVAQFGHEESGGQSQNGQTPGKDPCGGGGGGGDSNVEQRVYRCDYCSKTFLFKSKYHEHLPVHTSARPFQCHLCSRTYKYKYDLRVHLRTHLGIPTKSTVCPFCTDKFGTNKQLRAHIKDSHREQEQIGDEQRAKSLEGLSAVRERNPEQIQDGGSDGKNDHEVHQNTDGPGELFLLNQEGLDLSNPDGGRFKSPKKDSNDCSELRNAGRDFRLQIGSNC